MNRRCLMFVSCVLFNLLSGCASSPETIEIPKDAATMEVTFSWDGIKPCSHESPEIRVNPVPEGTVELHVKLTNLSVPEWNQGGGIVDSDGTGVVPAGLLDIGYNGPCPAAGSNRYAFSVMAVDAQGAVIGFGRAVRRFPPKNRPVTRD